MSIKNMILRKDESNTKTAQTWLLVTAALVVLFLAFFNLTAYPTTWFDEGSHLHVPKTLLRFGEYADISSDGFRYFGPTIGVGPTVMLPIAGVFKVFGIGLLQARVVMALYLLATIFVFYRLSAYLAGHKIAFIATALLVTSRGVGLLEYGRQVLGEVPGLFFVILGFYLWFSKWDKASFWRLFLAGLMLGLATVTKNQYLLLLAPTLLGAWILNLIYYRKTPQKVFLIPGIVTAACFGLWQVYMILYLGPNTASENLTLLREATGGAALVFDPDLMRRAVTELIDFKVYMSILAPVLVYGFLLVLPRKKQNQKWSVIYLFIVVNLVWYVFASISWLRYAFPALAFAALFVAKFFSELTNNFVLNWREFIKPKQKEVRLSAVELQAVFLFVLVAMILLPFGQTLKDVIVPPFNAPFVMATYMDEHVPEDVVVETWEPEMGFLTDHNYHYPPSGILNRAVEHIWIGGPSPESLYDFTADGMPPYVLVGQFSEWVHVYPPEILATNYTLVMEIGAYELYVLDGGS